MTVKVARKPRAKNPDRPRGKRWYCPKALRFALYTRDHFACAYCGTSVSDMDGIHNYLTLDHIECRCHGGALRDPQNLITACNLCNAGRGTKALADYATPGAQARIARLIATPINDAALKAANLDGRTGDSIAIEAARI